MATVLLLLDALRHDYVSAEHTPFLYTTAREGTWYRQIVPAFGFCERTEILTGLSPRDSGNFTAIGFDPAHSPYRGVHGLGTLAVLERLVPKKTCLPGSRRPGDYRRLYRRWAARWLLRGNKAPTLKPYDIPYNFLPYFALTEDWADHREPGAFPHPSLLDQLAAEGKTYCYDSFTALNLPSGRSDDERLQIALQQSRETDHDLYMIFVGELDQLGHHHGPDSAELRHSLSDLDQRLAEFVQALGGPGSHNFVFLGDHGMSTVLARFDAEAVIHDHAKRLGLKPVRDFIYFLDSTLVRIWSMSEKAGTPLLTSIREDPSFRDHGRFVDEALVQRLEIPWQDRRYGDLLWAANQGVLVFPDFFHRDVPCRGMHGYSPEDSPDNMGTCIVTGRDIPRQETQKAPLREVYHILRRCIFGE
ncbi:alkaline phosphatase family protein [Candidatus Neomarinimicrobiota bacterium]